MHDPSLQLGGVGVGDAPGGNLGAEGVDQAQVRDTNVPLLLLTSMLGLGTDHCTAAVWLQLLRPSGVACIAPLLPLEVMPKHFCSLVCLDAGAQGSQVWQPVWQGRRCKASCPVLVLRGLGVQTHVGECMDALSRAFSRHAQSGCGNLLGLYTLSLTPSHMPLWPFLLCGYPLPGAV
jgi:hypothetical protein